MGTTIKYSLFNVPNVQASGTIKDYFLFQLWTCVKRSENIEDTCLIIGYNQKPNGDYTYLVIPNSIITGDEEVEVIVVDQEHLERYFIECDRPNFGILRKPKTEDTVMCIAKGRYSGIEGGTIQKVLGMPEGRVRVWDNHHATYEDTYFVVIDERKSSKPTSTTKSLSGSAIISGNTINTSNSSITIDSSGLIRRNSLIDSDVKKRVVLKSEDVIRRNKLETNTIERRKVFTQKTIRRTK